MNVYNRYNIFFGWLSFIIAAVTYFLTMEPSVSWWDCGEFIAASYKLQVGHPPGAPLYLMLGRVFSIFAGNRENVAMAVNLLSVFASAFTVMFLFWTITHLCKKLLISSNNFSTENIILIIGSGLTGALAYTFSDTFWFSAVEAEVYGLSSLFTAVVFWAILKWENIAEEPHSDRWLLLIAYLIGLSIGVHLLNLLAIPAVVLVYYFRKHNKINLYGVIKALIVSFIILLFIMYIIINGLISIAAQFELFFVNKLGFTFNAGVWLFIILLVLFVIISIIYSHTRRMVVFNTIIVSFTLILIGYSSYMMIIIRSSANPPMDENNPNNVFSMKYYLNREQYGDRPLILGYCFDSKVLRDESGFPVIENGKPVYWQNKCTGRYEVAYYKQKIRYAEKARLFPRMYSRNNEHIMAYKSWGLIREGDKAGFLNNLAFFINYQVGHMYFRYFMWNFAGKQNDTQSHGSLVYGNWITGIKLFDEIRLGNQDKLPDKYKNEASRNSYYLLPFLLGISGLLYHLSKKQNDFLVIMVLFLMTGIAIVVYLNQTPYQPRERDYAYSGSFYSFSIWIGIGVISLYNRIKFFFKGNYSAVLSGIICILFIPGIMAQQNWDDHDRSDRFTVRDIAKNYLDSCEKNAILFTNGDNDTFPLWYMQDVEGYRTDVRVVNLMLLNADWYIEQLQRKTYLSDPLPITLPVNVYREGVNSVLYVRKNQTGQDLKSIIEGISRSDTIFKQKTLDGEMITVIPSNKFLLYIDDSIMLNSGFVNLSADEFIESPMMWELTSSQITKSNLIQLNILEANNWKRPIYFISGGDEGALNLEDYFQLEGLAYRIVPVRTESTDLFFNPGRIEMNILFDNLMNKFSWGGIDNNKVYLDYFNIRTFAVIKFRKNFIRLAENLIEEGKKIEAEKVLDRCLELAPDKRLPYDHFISGISYLDENNNIVNHSGIIETYYKCGAYEKANSLIREYGNILMQDLIYYSSLNDRFKWWIEGETIQSHGLYNHLVELAAKYSQEGIIKGL